MLSPVSSGPTFTVYGGPEAFDTFNSGEGTDTILGGDQNDTIRVNSLSSANSIEVIDGGGGNNNIIAGTSGNNTIDLSGIAVSHINRIEGGGGQDTITGTDHDDTIYGGSGDGYDDWARDYLYGGAGNDAYHIGIYDVISDSDHQGTIWYGANQISGLTLTQVDENDTTYASDNYVADYDANTNTLDVSDRNTSFTFTIENFSSGYFGLNLEAYQAPATDCTFSGPSAWSRAGGNSWLDNDGVAHWSYQFERFFADGTSDLIDQPISHDAPPSVNVRGSSGRDFLSGMNRSDIITGGAGDDTLYGWSPGRDEDATPLPPASADMGGDEIHGDGGNDYIIGSMGTDTLYGGADDDILSGMQGQDIIQGGSSRDEVLGGEGDDVLNGGAGDDYLSGDATANLNLNGTYYIYAWLQPDTGWQVFSDLAFSYAPAGYAIDVISASAGLFMNDPSA